jgi:hypothetical protein
VTITDYDSNDTALAKVRAGGHGFDIVVPSANYVPIWVKEGLLLEARPDQMENFKNVDERWVNVIGTRAATTPCRGSGDCRASASTPRSMGRHQHLRHLPRSAGRNWSARSTSSRK